MRFSLVDDGTLDTVLACDTCSQELRFNLDVPSYRDGGKPYTDAMRIVEMREMAEADHICICSECDAGDPTSVIRYGDCEHTTAGGRAE